MGTRAALASSALLAAWLVAGAVAQDGYFPEVHVRQQVKNWENDPNGPMVSPTTGDWHLFAQYNPFGATWGHMSWAHWISHDGGARWSQLPVALWPNQTYDADGVFSGSITIDDEGVPVIAYTCVGPGGQLQCLARPKDPSDPNLTQWVKDAGNPVIDSAPPGGNTANFRDPTTAWKDEHSGNWLMAFGTQINGTACVTVYESTDNMQSFGFRDHLYCDSSYTMFECPDLYPIATVDGRSREESGVFVGKVSTNGFSEGGFDMYALGEYNATRVSFTPQSGFTRYDFGKPFYASKTFYDTPRDRQVLWGWIQEEDANAAARGWQGLMTVPRVLTADPDAGILLMPPTPEFDTLRSAPIVVSDVPQHVEADAFTPLKTAAGGAAAGLVLDIDATFAVPKAWADEAACIDARSRVRASREERLAACVPSGAVEADSAVTPPFGVAVRAAVDGSARTDVTFSVVSTTGPANNTDRPGGDYRDYGLPAHAPEAQNVQNCSAECVADPECVAWTYVRPDAPPDPNYPAPRCSLKRDVPAPVVGRNYCVSGTVGALLLSVNRSMATGTGPQTTVSAGVRLPGASGFSALSMRVIVDNSVIEAYAEGGRAVITERVYPDPSMQSVGLVAGSDGATSLGVVVYPLESIWQ